MKQGKITPNGVVLHTHENATVVFLTQQGFDVELLVPNRRKGSRTPDIVMNGKKWEIKSPKGKSRRTIENNLRLALMQSPYIVLDLRRLDGRTPTVKRVNEVQRQFHLAKKIKRIIVITREGNLLDMSR